MTVCFIFHIFVSVATLAFHDDNWAKQQPCEVFKWRMRTVLAYTAQYYCKGFFFGPG